MRMWESGLLVKLSWTSPGQNCGIKIVFWWNFGVFWSLTSPESKWAPILALEIFCPSISPFNTPLFTIYLAYLNSSVSYRVVLMYTHGPPQAYNMGFQQTPQLKGFICRPCRLLHMKIINVTLSIHLYIYQSTYCIVILKIYVCNNSEQICVLLAKKWLGIVPTSLANTFGFSSTGCSENITWFKG